MTADSWKRLIVLAVFGVAAEAYCAFALFFAPGWANGWPFGLSLHTIWSGGMAFMLFILVMTGVAGLGAVVGLGFSRRGFGFRHGRFAFFLWLLIAAIVVALVSVWFFQISHSATLRMWPNGYPNRQAGVGSVRPVCSMMEIGATRQKGKLKWPIRKSMYAS